MKEEMWSQLLSWWCSSTMSDERGHSIISSCFAGPMTRYADGGASRRRQLVGGEGIAEQPVVRRGVGKLRHEALRLSLLLGCCCIRHDSMLVLGSGMSHCAEFKTDTRCAGKSKEAKRQRKVSQLSRQSNEEKAEGRSRARSKLPASGLFQQWRL